MSLNVILITGESGSGKSTVMRALEDEGYLCVDNLPAEMVESFLEKVQKRDGLGQIAFTLDVRDLHQLTNAPALVERLREGTHNFLLMYLEADERVLLRRFSETRRPHPLDQGDGLRDSIARGRDLLAPLRSIADVSVDTSTLSPHELRARIQSKFGAGSDRFPSVEILSFGFKHGLPTFADMILDVRFLPNPYFVPDLREKTGLQQVVRDYVLAMDDAQAFIDQTVGLLSFLLPRFQAEGKRYLTLAIGCTGGVHRSVSIAIALSERLAAADYHIAVHHRDTGVTS